MRIETGKSGRTLARPESMSVQLPRIHDMLPTRDYASPGLMTTLESIPAEVLPSVADPVEICSYVHSLVIQPADAQQLNLPEGRQATNEIRPAVMLLQALLQLDPEPLTVARPAESRIVGTCRHFAVISCALLRHRGIASRVRCGFATYFQPGQGVDHWITEYRDQVAGRWVRIDSEILGGTVLQHPENLEPGQFLSGGEAWQAFRSGQIDGAQFGVYGTDNWGPAEIRGNAVKDLAAMNKVEMLPWDEWGRMTDAYEGTTGAEYDDLLDTLAATCAADDAAAIAGLFHHDDLRVPSNLLC